MSSRPQPLSYVQAERDLYQGRTTCVEIVERCLERIEQWEPKVRAWAWLDTDGACAQARRVQERAEQLRSGASPVFSPVGLPFGIKDIIDRAGWPTGLGLDEQPSEPAEKHATVVGRLRADGGVDLGKTVTTPFAFLDPPPTRNPWNLSRTPGGSSSGSAAAVATGMCMAAFATQTGGSIIRPAAYCGVVGFKPSYGAVYSSGVFPLAPSLDHVGIIAATAHDVARVFASVFDLAWWCRLPERNDAIVKLHTLFTESGLEPARVSRLPRRVGLLHDLCRDHVTDEAWAVVERAAGCLQEAGVTVQAVASPTSLDDLLHAHSTILAAEAAWVHRDGYERWPERYPPRIRELVERGMTISAVEYVAAVQERKKLENVWKRLFWDCELLALPSTPGPAPDVSTTGDPRLNSPWSLLGVPTVTLPAGFASDGLPLGLQLVAARDADVSLLWASVAVETLLRSKLQDLP